MKTDPAMIVDRLYEAAVIPELWPDVCAMLAESVNGFSAAIFSLDEQKIERWVAAESIRDEMQRYTDEPHQLPNIRPQRHMERQLFSFARDIDLMTDEEVADDPIYNQILRPIGLGWTMGDIIAEPSGHLIMFDFIRETEKGPFSQADVDWLNGLKPDLSRSAFLASRLAFNQATAITQVMTDIGLAAAVVGDRGNVISMNPGMEALAPRVGAGARDVLHVENAAANTLFAEALQRLKAGLAPRVQSVAVPADGGGVPLVIQVLPVKRNARDIFSRSLALVVVTQVGQAAPPDLRVLSGLFDLTPAEARIAQAIATGAAVEDIARSSGLTLNTVRSHLKTVFSKTGVSRQAELVALLSAPGMPPAQG